MRAQPALPVVGFLRSTTLKPFENLGAAFQQGLKEAGFVEGQNVAIEYRYAENQLDRLPGLVADLLRRSVAVIVGDTLAAFPVKAATSTVPIVFATGGEGMLLKSTLSMSTLPCDAGNVTAENQGALTAPGLLLRTSRNSEVRAPLLRSPRAASP
jgi:putative ABC transport system substrate-binding protein